MLSHDRYLGLEGFCTAVCITATNPHGTRTKPFHTFLFRRYARSPEPPPRAPSRKGAGGKRRARIGRPAGHFRDHPGRSPDADPAVACGNESAFAEGCAEGDRASR